MARHAGDAAIGVLVMTLDGAFTGRGWQGTTLLGSLRGIGAEQAMWSPRAGRRSVWALVLHAAYWKYGVRQQIVRADERFPRSPSNWPTVPAGLSGAELERAWKADVRLLKDEHAALVEAVRGLEPRQLEAIPAGLKTFTYAQRVAGAAAHDAYHTGQIQVLKREWAARGSGRARGS